MGEKELTIVSGIVGFIGVVYLARGYVLHKR